MPPYSQSDRLTPNQWVVAGSVFGALVIASLALGFSAGRAPSGPKAQPTPVAEKPKAKPAPAPEPEPDPAPPAVKKTEPKTVIIKRPEPEPETKKEPEMKKEPEPEPKKPEPKPEPKKVEPKKPEVAKKVEPKKEPNGGAVTYVSHIQKIVQQKCLVCHGDPSKKGGLDMKTLALMIKGGKGGPGIVPGKPDDSGIWVAINDGNMPPSDKEQLTDAEKKMIHDWIMAGAKEK